MAEAHRTIRVSDLNGADRAAFVAALGAVFEHSPWIAERAFAQRPFAAIDDLHAAMAHAVGTAEEGEKLALLQAHPELAGKLARAGAMTTSSLGEQSGAGLDRLGDAEFARFESLNAAYGAKFGFPFIIAVRDHDKAGILDEFERRLGNGVAQEFEAALAEVLKIARFRLEHMLAE